MHILDCSRPVLAKNSGQLAAGSGFLTEIKPCNLLLITNVTIQLAATGEQFKLDHLHLKTPAPDYELHDVVFFFGAIKEYTRSNGSRDYSIECRPYNLHPGEVAIYLREAEQYLNSWLVKLRPLLVQQKVGNIAAFNNGLARMNPIPQHIIEDTLEIVSSIQRILHEIKSRRFYAVNTYSLPELITRLEQLYLNAKCASETMLALRKYHLDMLTSRKGKKRR